MTREREGGKQCYSNKLEPKEKRRIARERQRDKEEEETGGRGITERVKRKRVIRMLGKESTEMMI